MEQDIAQAINKLRETRRERALELEKLDTAISYMEELFGDRQMVIPQTVAAPRPAQPRVGLYTGLTIREASLRYLRAAATPQKTRVIAEELEAGGIRSSDTYRAIYNALREAGSGARLTSDKMWELDIAEE